MHPSRSCTSTSSEANARKIKAPPLMQLRIYRTTQVCPTPAKELKRCIVQKTRSGTNRSASIQARNSQPLVSLTISDSILRTVATQLLYSSCTALPFLLFRARSPFNSCNVPIPLSTLALVVYGDLALPRLDCRLLLFVPFDLSVTDSPFAESKTALLLPRSVSCGQGPLCSLS